MGIQTPHFGYNVRPKTATAGGTSLLHGIAHVMTAQNAWICASTTEQPSHSKHLNPQTPNGTRHGAPSLQQNSQLNVQSPIFPEHPGQSHDLYNPQWRQHNAQHSTTLSSLTASPPQHIVCLFVI
mmetsp:Transcript_38591/g.93508  ORF Transcript_38591/g.93508 Transcript_38591/m.93508 type:complete len:125 (-) Transcript_38591:96-470(-)